MEITVEQVEELAAQFAGRTKYDNSEIKRFNDSFLYVKGTVGAKISAVCDLDHLI